MAPRTAGELSTRDRLVELVPEAGIAIAHGRMP